jgi:hypothetical protein
VSGLALQLAVTAPDLAWRTGPDAQPVRLAGLSAASRCTRAR